MRASYTTVKTVTLADIPLKKVDFIVGGSAVGGSAVGGTEVGLLGQNCWVRTSRKPCPTATLPWG